MFLDDKLRDTGIIKRDGILETIVLPKKNTKKCGISINPQTKELKFVEGDNTFLVQKKIGVREKSLITFFKASNYIIAELLEGKVFIEEEGKVFSITSKSSKRKINNSDGIKWLTIEDFSTYLSHIVKRHYNLPNSKESQCYVNNLLFNILLENKPTIVEQDKNSREKISFKTYLFEFSITELFNDIGLNEFEYKLYEPQEKSEEEIEREKALEEKQLEELKKEQEEDRDEKLKNSKMLRKYAQLKTGEENIPDYNLESEVKQEFGEINDVEDLKDEEDN